MATGSINIGDLDLTRDRLELAGRRCEALTSELAEARADRDVALVAAAYLGMSRREAARVGRVSISSVQQTLERAGVVQPVPSRRHLYRDRGGAAGD